MDPETGKLDVDWVNVGTTKTQKDRSRMIVEIVQELEKEYGNEVPVVEILDLAVEGGIEREKAEKAIDMLKMDGICFSSSHNVVGFVR